jgi:hypothetical protein
VWSPIDNAHADPRRKRDIKPDRGRALELLAGCGAEGCTEGIMRAHGFAIRDMVELVGAGLASAAVKRVVAARPWRAVVGCRAPAVEASPSMIVTACVFFDGHLGGDDDSLSAPEGSHVSEI